MLVRLSIAFVTTAEHGVVSKAKKTCKCGCRGWCSYYPIVRTMAWDMDIGGTGMFPTTGHDDTPLQNPKRTARAGNAMGIKLACVLVRGDWPAFCDIAAFRQWSHNLSPCFLCNISKSLMGKHHSNISIDEGPWHDWQHAEYEAEVARCSIAS